MSTEKALRHKMSGFKTHITTESLSIPAIYSSI